MPEASEIKTEELAEQVAVVTENGQGSGDDSLGKGDEETGTSKIELRRERNREHARVSRERKRQRIEHLEGENMRLRQEIDAIRHDRAQISARLSYIEHENTRLREWARSQQAQQPAQAPAQPQPQVANASYNYPGHRTN